MWPKMISPGARGHPLVSEFRYLALAAVHLLRFPKQQQSGRSLLRGGALLRAGRKLMIDDCCLLGSNVVSSVDERRVCWELHVSASVI